VAPEVSKDSRKASDSDATMHVNIMIYLKSERRAVGTIGVLGCEECYC
jgi:hypothetical protein